jgi:HprK-related kinase B
MRAEHIAAMLTNSHTLRDEGVLLDLNGLVLSIRSNAPALLRRLKQYFSHLHTSKSADIEVLALEAPAADLSLPFQDWRRELGKAGHKDTYHDLPDGRLIRKLRTGMVFLQSASHRIACGPCITNFNQVVNFVNAQAMNWLQQQGAVICHAAVCCAWKRCLGIAGFSGGGKSTLALHVLEDPRMRFVTNDRLFLSKGLDGHVEAIGIPKMPRVNPGTILSLLRLHPLLNEDRRRALQKLSRDELWELEEKYDVDVRLFYGTDRVTSHAPLKAMVILNWQRDANSPCVANRVDIAARPNLLQAVMKSPGPFYQREDGSFLQNETTIPAAPYLKMLQGVDVWEISGKVDFRTATQRCLEILAIE